MIDQSNYQEPLKKKVAFSNSISGTTSGLNVQPRAPALVDTNKTFDGINEIIGAVNSYLSTGSAAAANRESNATDHSATKFQNMKSKHQNPGVGTGAGAGTGMSVTHQKNS